MSPHPIVVVFPDDLPERGTLAPSNVPKVLPHRRRSTPMVSLQSAWSAWQSGSTQTSSPEFLIAASSWIEGTAAQLARRRWATGVGRQTSMEVERLLRDKLTVAAAGGESTYLEGLAWARCAVIEELGGAAPHSPQGTSD
jgi:hypothetical protein